MFLVLLYQGGAELSGLKAAFLAFLEWLCGLRLSLAFQCQISGLNNTLPVTATEPLNLYLTQRDIGNVLLR